MSGCAGSDAGVPIWAILALAALASALAFVSQFRMTGRPREVVAWVALAVSLIAVLGAINAFKGG